MTFSETKREFECRLYLWAKSEWEKEVNGLFPHLRVFRTGTAWETYQFMVQLGRAEQMTLSHGLIKRYFSDVLEDLGEVVSAEEEFLCYKRDEFFRIRGLFHHVKHLEESGRTAEARFILQRIRPAVVKIFGQYDCGDDAGLASHLERAFLPFPVSLEEEIAARSTAGEMIEFSSTRTLRSALIKKFKASFGAQCVGPEYLVNELEPQFQMKVCSWILTTTFFWNREKGRIEYSHNILSEDMFDHQGPGNNYMKTLMIAQNVSFCSWLGISGVTQWKYIVNKDIETVCNTVIDVCRLFFEIAPKLLKGLEVDKIRKPVF